MTDLYPKYAEPYFTNIPAMRHLVKNFVNIRPRLLVQVPRPEIFFEPLNERVQAGGNGAGTFIQAVTPIGFTSTRRFSLQEFTSPSAKKVASHLLTSRKNVTMNEAIPKTFGLATGRLPLDG